MTNDYTLDELMIATMSHYLQGEVLVSSVTAFGAMAALLAKKTHAPDLAVLSTPESGMDVTPMPTLTLGQFLTDVQNGIPLTMEEIFDAIFTDHFRIWINPAQIDRYGNVNISAIGEWDHPKVALVGSRGIPEDTSHLSQILYYVTSHNPRTLVEQVDFRSGAGHSRERRESLGDLGSPTVLVTNLGVFSFHGPDHHMDLHSTHPGVSLDTIQAQTGFALPPAPHPIPVTPAPTPQEIAIIRAADPLQVRQLELLSGPEAAAKFVEIFERERQALHAAWPRGGRASR